MADAPAAGHEGAMQARPKVPGRYCDPFPVELPTVSTVCPPVYLTSSAKKTWSVAGSRHTRLQPLLLQPCSLRQVSRPEEQDAVRRVCLSRTNTKTAGTKPGAAVYHLARCGAQACPWQQGTCRGFFSGARAVCVHAIIQKGKLFRRSCCCRGLTSVMPRQHSPE